MIVEDLQPTNSTPDSFPPHLDNCTLSLSAGAGLSANFVFAFAPVMT